jgi:hypothetical protein
MHPMTDRQSAAVDRLVAKGWTVNFIDDDTAYLMKRGKHRGQTIYCQVDQDGLIEGHEDGVALIEGGA